jgi:hypothetical protein
VAVGNLVSEIHFYRSSQGIGGSRLAEDGRYFRQYYKNAMDDVPSSDHCRF